MTTRKTVWILTAITAASMAEFHGTAAKFSEDVAFLKDHTEVIVLADKTGRSKVAVAPDFQGRVMTSSADGESGQSFGWINRELIGSGKVQPHINARGGEDRFWLGPEGGQFSIFFAPGATFDLEHWFTPATIDTEAYKVISKGADRVKFEASLVLTNYSRTRLEVKVEREVRLLNSVATWKKLGLKPREGVNLVGYETDNRITNAGRQPWKKDTGLLSIWILGMFNPSPGTVIVAPIREGPEADLGPKVTSDYFGAVPPERLAVKEKFVFFSGDGKFRSKIGLSPKRSRGVIGSYESSAKVLTIVQFTQPEGVTDYVNSLWKLQDHPYGGDAANSYNDGPPSPGAKPMGPFYELESSSPAAALEPGRSLTHVHRTVHLSGEERVLEEVARVTLGVSLAEIKSSLGR
jgi:hypothetical protein